MKNFFAWYEQLPWQPALLFMAALVVFLLILVLLVDGAIRAYAAWSEDRAILRQELKRRAEDRKRESEKLLLVYPIKHARIERSQVDPAYRSGRFHVPYSMLDKKGVTKL